MTFGFGGEDHTRFSASSNGIAGASSDLEGFALVMSFKEERVVFNYELGQSIAQWSHVERILGDLAAQCLAPADYKTTIFGYYAIENFRSKLDFVDSMIQRLAGDYLPLRDEWATLDERLRSGARVRNQLAHWTICEYPDAPEGRRIALVNWSDQVLAPAVASPRLPRHSVQRTPRTPPSHSLTLEKLGEAQSRFFGLYMSVMNFRDILIGQPKPIPTAYERGYLPLKTRELESRFRSALGLPQKPSRQTRRSPGDEAAEQERQKMRSEAAQ